MNGPLPTSTLATVTGGQARSLTATAYELARLVATYRSERRTPTNAAFPHAAGPRRLIVGFEAANDRQRRA
jgi:hypothetical protein